MSVMDWIPASFREKAVNVVVDFVSEQAKKHLN